LAVDPSGLYVFAANAIMADSVATFSINQAGALTQTGTPASSGSMPVSVVVDPSGQFVYVVSAGSGNVFIYTIDAASGALTPAAQSPVAAGLEPRAIAVD
jgi:6-phosphogluconolactonase (cycloisomerase 2 family)